MYELISLLGLVLISESDNPKQLAIGGALAGAGLGAALSARR